MRDLQKYKHPELVASETLLCTGAVLPPPALPFDAKVRCDLVGVQ